MISDNDLAIPAKMMDLYAAKHKLVAHNLANANVDGYHKLSVSFDKELDQIMNSNDPQQISKAAIKITRAAEAGVDMDAEVAVMSKNQVMFQAFSEIARYRLRMLRAATNVS